MTDMNALATNCITPWAYKAALEAIACPLSISSNSQLSLPEAEDTSYLHIRSKLLKSALYPSPILTAIMPEYKFSAIFKRVSFVAFCRLHQINAVSQDDLDRSLLRLFGYMRHYHLHNDLGISQRDLAVRWPRFGAALYSCERQGFTTANLSELIDVVIELGGDRVAWSSTFEMDGSGGLRVTQAP